MPTIPYKNKDGKRIPGATTIPGQNVGWGKDALIYWANAGGLEGKDLNELRDSATVSGTVAHLMIECDLLVTTPNLTPYKQEDIDKAEVAYLAYLDWRKQFSFEPLAVEPHLVSEKYQYGLTPDVIGYVKDKLSLIDWKTGRIYENTFLQLAAYKQGWEENNPDKPIEGGFHVLRIPKNEETPSFHHSYWAVLPPEAWECFECALKLHENKKALKKLL